MSAHDLMSAIFQNNIQSLMDLLQSGIHPDIRFSESEETALMIVARDSCPKNGNRNEQMMYFLLNAGADPNLQDGCGKTAIMWAVENYEDETIYVQEDVDDIQEETPMYFSSASAIKTLLSYGANTCIKNEYGESAYDVATPKALEILKMFDKQRMMFKIFCLSKM